MNSIPSHNIDSGLDRIYRPRFKRLLPLLLERRRAVQIGDSRKYSESTKLRHLALYRWIDYILCGITIILIGLGVFFARSGNGVWAMIAFEFAIFGGMLVFIAKIDQYIPSRWLVLRDGLLLRSSKDRRVFFPWRSIRGFSAKYGFKWNRIGVRIDEDGVERTEWIHAEADPLLPFLTKLLEALPDGIDRDPLLKLQRKLRYTMLHASFFRSKESNVAIAMVGTLPVIVILSMCFPAADIGFATWFTIMGTILALFFGAYVFVRNRMRLRHINYLNGLLDELERPDIDAVLDACRETLPDFGPPPRTISDKVKRYLLFSGGSEIILPVYCGMFAFFALMFAAILFVTAKSDIRYGFLLFRWEKAGEGRIAQIADSSTERAPNGNPAKPGRDVITLEQTLPDGRTIRCRNPGWPPSGRFQVGQTVSLLRYHGDPECLLLDDPFSYREMYLGLGAACFFLTVAVVVIVGMLCYDFSRRRQIVRLMETAAVERFRVGKTGKRTMLFSLAAGREPIPIGGIGSIAGETVNVFYDENAPKLSFVAESTWTPLTFNSATGEIDCVSDRPYWMLLVSPGLFALGVGLGFLRILLAY